MKVSQIMSILKTLTDLCVIKQSVKIKTTLLQVLFTMF